MWCSTKSVLCCNVHYSFFVNLSMYDSFFSLSALWAGFPLAPYWNLIGNGRLKQRKSDIQNKGIFCWISFSNQWQAYVYNLSLFFSAVFLCIMRNSPVKLWFGKLTNQLTFRKGGSSIFVSHASSNHTFQILLCLGEKTLLSSIVMDVCFSFWTAAEAELRGQSI